MFSNLTPTQFEELCKDLLEAQYLENINWRKGTGHISSPADNGRDIECEYHRYDHIIGRIIIEKWFIECKHYKEGVPPEKIQSALTWAQAERPQRLIIITSGFLSNSCKNHLKTFKETNKPNFEIEIWERSQLEKKLKRYPHLLKQYKIEMQDDLLNYIHFLHLRYMEKDPMINFEILENAINQLSQTEKLMIFELVFLKYCQNKDIIPNIEKKSYEEIVMHNLKQQCKNTNDLAINTFLHTTMNVLLGAASPNEIERTKDFQQSLQQYIIKKLDGKENENLENLFNKDSYRLDKEKMLNLYNNFCNKVIKYIFENPYIPKVTEK